jgi:hypothetical protein
MNIRYYLNNKAKLLILLFPIVSWNCSSNKPSTQINIIPLEDESVRIVVEKLENISNTSEKYYDGIIETDDNNDSVNDTANQDYPNPFSPSTIIKFVIAEPDSFSVSLIDVNGNTIKTSYNNYLYKGYYEISFSEVHVNSGVYFIVVESRTKKWQKKIILLK